MRAGILNQEINMLTQQVLHNILDVATFIGIIFAVYLYFRKPQEKSEVTDAVFEVRFQTLEKMVINLRDNHIHTIESKLDKHISDQQVTTEANIRQMTRIETLLEERLPRK